MKTPIYLDHHATTPVDPRVLNTLLPYLKEDFGNASSRNHLFGKKAGQAVESAREEIQKIIGAQDPSEIIFTSGATESNNLALKGIAHVYRDRGNHIITTPIEHRSVLDTCQYLQEQGFRITYLKINRDGLIDLEELKSSITDQTILISIMHANNEIGVLQPITEIGRIAKQKGVFFHCDAVQSIGKVHVDVESMGIDLMSISAHKVYGPKGIGVLYVRKRNPRVRLEPLIHGGGQERGMRSGTLHVSGIIGFGKALEIAQAEMSEESIRLFTLRERLRKKIFESLDDVHINGSLEKRLPGNLNLSFSYVEGEALLTELQKDLAVSSGSACTEASLEPSYVLRALGTREDLVHTSLRFGIGRFNTEEEIDYAAGVVIGAVKKLRALSSLYKAVHGAGCKEECS